jgi:hypothetical protein
LFAVPKASVVSYPSRKKRAKDDCMTAPAPSAE